MKPCFRLVSFIVWNGKRQPAILKLIHDDGSADLIVFRDTFTLNEVIPVGFTHVPRLDTMDSRVAGQNYWEE